MHDLYEMIINLFGDHVTMRCEGKRLGNGGEECGRGSFTAVTSRCHRIQLVLLFCAPLHRLAVSSQVVYLHTETFTISLAHDDNDDDDQPTIIEQKC